MVAAQQNDCVRHMHLSHAETCGPAEGAVVIEQLYVAHALRVAVAKLAGTLQQCAHLQELSRPASW